VRKINPELWLVLFLVVIAAMINFFVASQRMALVIYFLPVLYSAYRFGRRHATLTAVASVTMVVILTWMNPSLFSRKAELPFDTRFFDYAVWGGILMVAGYATGTLYEVDQNHVKEMKQGYDAMLAILQHVLSNEKYSDAHAYRISMRATKIAESLGLDPQSTEDVRTAALLGNVNQLGISNEILCKAANVSEEELEQRMKKAGRGKMRRKPQSIGGALQRAIPLLAAEQALVKSGGSAVDAPLEVQVLALAEAYETLVSETGPRKMSPQQAEEIIVKSSGKKYDSMVVDAFVKAFGQQTQGAGA